MNDEVMHLIVEKIGIEYFMDGVALENSNVWMSEASIITRTCDVCGVEFTGIDYEVWRILGAHQFGHALDSTDTEGMEA